jgi:hypothetical protein
MDCKKTFLFASKNALFYGNENQIQKKDVSLWRGKMEGEF